MFDKINFAYTVFITNIEITLHYVIDYFKEPIHRMYFIYNNLFRYPKFNSI